MAGHPAYALLTSGASGENNDAHCGNNFLDEGGCQQFNAQTCSEEQQAF